MKNTIRAYLPVGGAAARRTAWRLFCLYGIRPQLIARNVSLLDRLLPIWQVSALPTELPDSLLADALLAAATSQHDDRLAVLYLPDDAFLLPYRDMLERGFVLRHANGRPLSEPLQREVGA